MGNFGSKKRFGDKCVCSRHPKLVLNLGVVIGGYHNDGNIHPQLPSNHLERFQSVHSRHLPVQNKGEEVVLRLMGFHNAANGFFAREYPAAPHPQIIQNLGGAFADNLVIIHHKYRQPGELCIVILCLFAQLKGYSHNKLASFSQDALNLNRAIHHADNILGNSHAKTCPLYLVGL